MVLLIKIDAVVGEVMTLVMCDCKRAHARQRSNAFAHVIESVLTREEEEDESRTNLEEESIIGV